MAHYNIFRTALLNPLFFCGAICIALPILTSDQNLVAYSQEKNSVPDGYAIGDRCVVYDRSPEDDLTMQKQQKRINDAWSSLHDNRIKLVIIKQRFSIPRFLQTFNDQLVSSLLETHKIPVSLSIYRNLFTHTQNKFSMGHQYERSIDSNWLLNNLFVYLKEQYNVNHAMFTNCYYTTILSLSKAIPLPLPLEICRKIAVYTEPTVFKVDIFVMFDIAFDIHVQLNEDTYKLYKQLVNPS